MVAPEALTLSRSLVSLRSGVGMRTVGMDRILNWEF
jgi:hypothetical protein